jgi:hypothetical protein
MDAYDLLGKMQDCCRGAISVDQFEGWFDSASWNAHKDNVLSECVFSIEALFSAYLGREINDIEFRRELFLCGMALQTRLKQLAEAISTPGSLSTTCVLTLAYGSMPEMTDLRVSPMSVSVPELLALAYA